MDADLFENALQIGADGRGFDAEPMRDNLVGQIINATSSSRCVGEVFGQQAEKARQRGSLGR
jgi:hypothetical protein